MRYQIEGGNLPAVVIELDDCYVILKDNGTGTMSYVGEATDLKWSDCKITIEGEDLDYIIKGDELTFDIEDSTMVFKRSKNAPPTK